MKLTLDPTAAISAIPEIGLVTLFRRHDHRIDQWRRHSQQLGKLRSQLFGFKQHFNYIFCERGHVPIRCYCRQFWNDYHHDSRGGPPNPFTHQSKLRVGAGAWRIPSHRSPTECGLYVGGLGGEIAVTGSTLNNGAISADSGGTVYLGGQVYSNGLFNHGSPLNINGGSLILGAADSEPVDFQGGGELVIDQPSAFSGRLSSPEIQPMMLSICPARQSRTSTTPDQV